MGGGNMQINKIENANARQELGNFAFASSNFSKKTDSLQPILPRCNKFVGFAKNSTSDDKLELKQEPWEAYVHKEEISKLKQEQLKLVSKAPNVIGFSELHQFERKMKEGLKSVQARKPKNETDVSKEEILKLKLKQLQLLDKDLSGMGLYELEQVEQELNKGLLSVWARKDKLMKEQMEQSKVKEERAVLKNKNFHRQVQERRGSRPATVHPAPICFGYNREEKKETPANNISESPDAVADGGAENDYYSDNALYLWHCTCLVLILSVLFFVVGLAVVLL